MGGKKLGGGGGEKMARVEVEVLLEGFSLCYIGRLGVFLYAPIRRQQ